MDDHVGQKMFENVQSTGELKNDVTKLWLYRLLPEQRLPEYSGLLYCGPEMVCV